MVYEVLDWSLAVPYGIGVLAEEVPKDQLGVVKLVLNLLVKW